MSTVSGQLDFEIPGSQGRFRQDVDDALEEARTSKLDGRDVDRHEESAATASYHALGLPARFMENPEPDRFNQPAVLGHRHELGRFDQSAARVAPADQRLGADDAAGFQVHLRLVEQLEFLLVERLSQAGFDRQAVRRPARSSRARKTGSRSAAVLRFV